MKRLFIAAVVILMVFGSTAWALPKLSGYVDYSTGGGVGSGRPVKVWFSAQDYTTVYTRAGIEDSWYVCSFNPGTYFWKVVCGFVQGGKYWKGTTIINQTLYSDTRYDITVYVIGQDP